MDDFRLKIVEEQFNLAVSSLNPDLTNPNVKKMLADYNNFYTYGHLLIVDVLGERFQDRPEFQMVRESLTQINAAIIGDMSLGLEPKDIFEHLIKTIPVLCEMAKELKPFYEILKEISDQKEELGKIH